MKKLLSVVTLLGALAGAASAAPYTLPAPAGGALTPYDWQPVYSIQGLYSFADDSDDPDTYGLRGSFSLYNSAEGSVRHEFNINAAWLTGDKDGAELTLMPITLGYNINLGLSDSVFFYLGGKAGYAFVEMEAGEMSESYGGFTYSIGAGLMIQCSSALYVHFGYEFGRTYIEVDGADSHAIYGAHTILLGVGCTF